jgi:FkbM family methyltransferase
VVKARLVDGITMLLDARSRVEAGALWNGVYDEDDLAFMRATIDKPMTVVDVGANVGLIALPLAKYLNELRGGNVIAVEPVEVNATRLEASARLMGLDQIIRVHRFAAGEERGHVSIAKEGPSRASGNAVVGLGEGPMVTVRPLDEIVPAGASVGFIKMDVEGYEASAMRGARSIISTSRPIIYGEFNNHLMPQRGESFMSAFDVVAALDYEVFAFRGRCDVVRVTPHPSLGNAVLVPSEKVNGWLERLRRAQTLR